jgi:hypothetical protein
MRPAECLDRARGPTRNARDRQSNDDVGRFDNRRVCTVLEPNIARAIEHSRLHHFLPNGRLDSTTASAMLVLAARPNPDDFIPRISVAPLTARE